jgi:ribosome-binding factor A
MERRTSHRPNRMADLIRKEVASYLQKGAKDPRIGFVTVTQVTMTKDLQIARIYYTAYGSDKEKAETTEGLHESVKEIRQHLGKQLHTRYTPKLEFFVDEGLEHSYKIQSLLGSIAHELPTTSTESSAEDDPDAADLDKED